MKYIIIMMLFVIMFFAGCLSLDACPEQICENETVEVIKDCVIDTVIDCPACEVCQECQVCETCATNESNMLIILEGEYKHQIGWIYQNFADEHIELFDDYYYDKKFDNCSNEIKIARDHLNTAMGFYGLAKKEFEKIPEDIIAKEYIIAMKEMVNHNEDLIENLKDYENFCNNYADDDVDVTPRELDDRDHWEEKYILHKANYDKQLRLIEELR